MTDSTKPERDGAKRKTARNIPIFKVSRGSVLGEKTRAVRLLSRDRVTKGSDCQIYSLDSDVGILPIVGLFSLCVCVCV